MLAFHCASLVDRSCRQIDQHQSVRQGYSRPTCPPRFASGIRTISALRNGPIWFPDAMLAHFALFYIFIIFFKLKNKKNKSRVHGVQTAHCCYSHAPVAR